MQRGAEFIPGEGVAEIGECIGEPRDLVQGGEIVLHRADTVAPTIYYNLGGQRVSSPQRGLYISRGKKLMVK